MQRFKRLVALVVIVSIFAIGLVRPRPARASTTDDVIIGLVGFAAYIGIVVLITKLVYKYDDDNAATADDPLASYEQKDGSVRFVKKCRQQGGDVTVACW